MNDKKVLRKEFLARRASIGAAERREYDAEICANLLHLEHFRNAPSVAVYATDGEEPDLSALLTAVPEKRFLFPRYAEKIKAYELVEVTDFAAQMRVARYGLLEPLPELPAVPEKEIRRDVLFLTPAVACDRRGGRLGRGGGFYDRLLLLPERPSVAVIYHCQWSSALVLEPHDRRVGCVVTEREIYEVPEAPGFMK